LGCLQIDILLRIGATCIQDSRSGHFELFAAELLVNLDLYREAVAVVARDVRRIIAGHGFRFDDEILQPFIQRVSEVDGPIGIRRTIVEEVNGTTLAGLAQLLIEAQLGPASQPKWLILGEIRLHREGSLRQS